MRLAPRILSRTLRSVAQGPMRVRTAAILASASALRAPGTQRTTKLPQRLFSAAFDEPGDDYDVAAPPPESLEYLSVLAGGETYTREFKTCQSRSGVFLRISESPCSGATRRSRAPVERRRYDPATKVIKDKVGKYVNAFTNSGGGEILFGVDDDGAVSGCVLAPEEMGQVTRLVDGATQRVDPQLDVDAVRCVYVPVVGPGSGPDRYVVVVRVKKGSGEPVYFQGADRRPVTATIFERCGLGKR